MAKKKTVQEPATRESPAARTDAYRTFHVGDDVVIHCLDDGAVEILQDSAPVTFDDELILRWGRKRG